MLVEVRPLFPVHLDGDEIGVDEPGRFLVGEGFPLHDVAPVARRIADGEEDRLVLPGSVPERLLTPRVPVHRIFGMLEEVRAFLPGETVGLPGCRFRVADGSGHRYVCSRFFADEH